MTHSQEDFFDKLQKLQDEFLVNMYVENGKLKFEFAEDPRLVERVVIRNGRRVKRWILPKNK